MIVKYLVSPNSQGGVGHVILVYLLLPVARVGVAPYPCSCGAAMIDREGGGSVL